MLLAVVTVGLFALAAWMRGSAAVAPSWPVLALELGGVLVLGAVGWVGGTLVIRDQISVDHRYAGGGQWNEATVERETDGTIIAAKRGELAVDQMKLLKVDGQRIVLARTATGYAAFDDACTHKGGSLAGGTMICGVVQCPGHGAQFDTRTGSVRAGPATRPLNVYRVEDGDGLVRIALPDADCATP
jgi:nitrite reductase/ring-hydroxylating ferredoxin subunit